MAKVYDNATDLITFARLQAQNTTSGSSYLGSDGLLKFAAEDEPRIEYGSDGSLKGLLIEEQRTNLVTYSTPDAGTPTNWGSGSGGTRTLTTLSNGLPALRFQANAERPYIQQAVTLSANTTYTLSVYVEAGYTAGTRPVLLISDLTGATGTTKASLGSEDSNGRISVTFTTGSDVNCNIRYGLGTDTNDAGDVTLGGMQLEEGSFPTSYIPTSGSTVTRSPDIASIPVSAFGYNQEAGTVVVEFATLATFGSRDGNDGVFSLRDNSTDGDDLVQAFITPTDNLKAQVISGGSSLFSTIILANLPEQTQTKTAVGFTGGSYAASVDGGAAQSLSTSTTYPVAGEITELAIGEINNNGTKHLNGHIKSLSYFPRRLTDIQLQELTA